MDCRHLAAAITHSEEYNSPLCKSDLELKLKTTKENSHKKSLKKKYITSFEFSPRATSRTLDYLGKA